MELNEQDPDAAPIASAAHDWIDRKKPANIKLSKWMKSPVFFDDQPGIEDRLIKLRTENSNEDTVQIPFTNGFFRELHEVFNEGGNFGWWESYIENAFEFCQDVAGFEKNLMNEYWRRTGTLRGLTRRAKNFIREHYHEMRRQLDTFRAIHRLVILGVISDFTVDYNSETILAKLRRVSDDDVRNHLSDYFSRYTNLGSSEYQEYMEIAAAAEDNTELRRCARTLITFVYKKIETKRRQNIALMEEIVREGIDRPAIFHERVNNFFDSRFTDYLRTWKDQYETDDIFKIIDEVTSDVQNIKQLLGSCDRLLVEKPANGLYHALRAYALSAVGVYAESYILDSLVKAIGDLFKDDPSKRRSRHQFLVNLRQRIIIVNPSNATGVDTFLVDSHRNWLHEFNKMVKNEVNR